MITLPDCDNVATLFIPHVHHKLVVHHVAHVVHAVHTFVDTCLGGGGLGWGAHALQPWSSYTEAGLGVTTIPEPTTTALLVLGFLMVGVLNKYRRA